MIRTVTAVAVAAVGVALVTIYPWFLDASLARFGTRATAAGLAAVAALTLPLRARRLPGSAGLPFGLLALLLGAATTGEGVFLRLIPAWIHLGLAWICVPICVATPARAAASRMTRASQTLWVSGFSQ